MGSPLSPLGPSTYNSNLIRALSPSKPPSLPLQLSRDILSAPVEPEDEITWDEEPSSPFVTEVNPDDMPHDIMDDNTTTRTMVTAIESPVKPMGKVDATTNANPSKMDKTPFDIHIDEPQSRPQSSDISIVTESLPALPLSPVESNLQNSRPGHIIVETTVEESIMLETESTSIEVNEDVNIDDTCFSTFSEVPNADMTLFARLGNRSPPKHTNFSSAQDETPRPHSRRTPLSSRTPRGNISRTPSPTPRRYAQPQPPLTDNDTTNLLLDFTQQFESLSSSHIRSPTRSSPTKGHNPLSHLQNARTPSKNPSTPQPPSKILNLLDFELPPAPTPRSIPTITIRELESLKSSYASQISALKATLSGREAEVEALSRAVSDAERRVGEAQESAREERNKREVVTREKEDWERRGREFEDVLKNVKSEVLASERERAELLERVDAAEERAREAEGRAADAEAREAEARSKVLEGDVAGSGAGAKGDDAAAADGVNLFTAAQVQAQVDAKIHALSTELHAIYKKKHVTKVAGLKKGFEAKTRERTAELQARVEALERANEELQSKIDGTLSGVQVLPGSVMAAAAAGEQLEREEREQRLLEEVQRQAEEQKGEMERTKAVLVGRDEELKAARREFACLLKELERERVEKGELVAAVDEMLALQAAEQSNAANANVAASAGGMMNPPATPSQAATAAVEDYMRKSVGVAGSAAGAAAAAAGRPSGLRGPGFGVSRIAAPGGGASGLARPVGNFGLGMGKSRMMSNIERMGSGRGGD